MNIQQLKYFVEVCRSKSFSKASERLFISQQGVNMAILRLESEFSTDLFVRTPKGLMLTRGGEFLLERAQIILQEYARCEEYFNLVDGSRSVLNVAGVQGVISEFGADIITDFQDTHPGFSVHLREYTDRVCDQMVDSQEAEVGLGLEPLDTSRFDCWPLLAKRLVLLVHKDHPLARRRTIPTALLQNLPMAFVDEKMKSADHFLSLCKKQGVRPKVLYRVGEITAIHRLVRQNKCAGLSVETVAETLNTPDTVAIPFEDEAFLWAVDLFTKKGVDLSPGAETFCTYLREHMDAGT